MDRNKRKTIRCNRIYFYVLKLQFYLNDNIYTKNFNYESETYDIILYIRNIAQMTWDLRKHIYI